MLKKIYRIVNTKSKDWNFQDEWRLFGKPNTKAVIPINAVYVGVNASEANKISSLKSLKKRL